MKRKLMLLLACLFVGIGLVTAQTQRVTGVVISDEDGQPVIGASVQVKGTQQGTITDVDGKFTLPNVPSSAGTIVVSFVGMKTEEIEIQPNMTIRMKANDELLDEVVIVGYGTAKNKLPVCRCLLLPVSRASRLISACVVSALSRAARHRCSSWMVLLSHRVPSRP